MTFEEATSYLPKDVKTVEAAQSELRMLARDAALKGISRDALKEAAQKVIKKIGRASCRERVFPHV